ncbi:MAG TPA: hypothetical protein VFP12_16020 [Allosphingosinicella sp.]|nr:hypothetical protein [Allosphingosinicella sp.]
MFQASYQYWSIALYIAVSLGVLIWTLLEGRTRRESRGIEREAIGTARYSWWIVGLTVAATMLGPADALGLSAKGYTHGYIWALGPLGAALAQIVAGVFFVRRIKMKSGKPQTLGDIFSERFGPSARVGVGALIVLQAIPFAGLLVLAGAQILDTFMGVPKLYGIIAVAGSIGVMTAAGGLATVVRTDIFQSGLIIVMLFVVLGTTLSILFSGAPVVGPSSPPPAEEVTFAAIFAVTLTYFFGELLLPFYAQRALMARSPDAARWGFILAGLLAGVWYFVVTGAGVAARAVHVADPEFVLLGNITAVLGTTGFTASLILALAFVSLLALTHSTFDAILNTGGTALARDVVGGVVKLDADQQGVLARLAMLFISLLGMVIPFIWSDLIDILLVGYTIWAPTMMPIFAWLILTEDRRHPTKVFWLALAAGVLGWWLAPKFLPDEIPAVLLGVVANVAVLFVMLGWRGRGPDPSVEVSSTTQPR